MLLGYASESKGYRLWFPDSKRVIQRFELIFNETVMFYLGKEFAISIDEQQDDNGKMEFEVPSNVPQGGDTVSHSSSEDHIQETNPIALISQVLKSCKLHITTPLLVTGHEEPPESLHATQLMTNID